MTDAQPPSPPKQRLALKGGRNGRPCREPWRVLVVDDEPQVHEMTRVLLRDFSFQDRPFEVISAHSAAEAKSIIADNPEIPVMLLDVVMETDDAGLELARDIRHDLKNDHLRIILRTGQPGEAPERDVMLLYDINDYKSKTELTAQKMFTALIGALRSWVQLDTIEKLNINLEERIEDRTRALEEARHFAEQLIEMMPNPVWYKAAEGRFRLYNRAFRDLFGIGEDSWIGLTGREALGETLGKTDALTDARVLIHPLARLSYEATVSRPDGEAFTVMISKGAFRSHLDHAGGVIGVITDISERKSLERELRRLATTDALTGAANRRQFYENAEHEVERCQRYLHPLSLLMLDIDFFKKVNDRYGHAAGDEVLKAVVGACRALLRDVDCLGRLGGEEFGVLLPETDLSSAIEVAERLRGAISAIRIPHDGGEIAVTASLGATERQDTDTVDQMLARADASLYRAKATGRDRVMAGC